MAQEGLLGLTLWRPWPNLIERQIKMVENRPWHPRRKNGLQPGDWFAIHAGKKWDDGCIPMAQRLGVSLDIFMEIPDGVITCIARYDGHTDDVNEIPEAQRPWFFSGEKNIGWILGDVVTFPPIPCKGAQGLWKVPDDVTAEIRERFRSARAPQPPPPADR
jgi:hypothetical protein